MFSEQRRAQTLTIALAALMAIQSLLGLILQDQYHYAESAAPMWLGNDLVTLIVVVPALIVASWLALKGSRRATLVWTGALAFSAFNYARYLFGVSFGTFFPLYAVLLLLAVATFVTQIARVDKFDIAEHFRPKTPEIVLGILLIVAAAALVILWLTNWAMFAFGDWDTPLTSEAFKIVAALDLVLLAPVLIAAGIFVWRRRAWGYVLGPMAALASSIYLLVLTIDAGIATLLGITHRLGEWWEWTIGLAFIGTIATILFVNASPPLPPRTREARP